MEGGMPAVVVVENEEVGSGVGGAKGVGEERQLAEKLEKSEAGRRKLRQAIVLLKEKLEATSNALEVNDALRREVERERVNVEAERQRAEAERALREKAEGENSAIKEQFLGVVQRLESFERSWQADRDEVGRIRGEVREAVGGIGAALQAVEATQGLFQSLERTLLAKINGAVQSSSRALALAQSGLGTTSRAQAAALAAQSLAKAVQKEVQLVSSQVVALQKQASNLGALESSLQQESQLRGPGTPLNSPDSGEANISLPVSKEKVCIDAGSPSRAPAPSQGTVVARNQTEAQEFSQAKGSSGEGDVLNMLVASAENCRTNAVSCSIGLPPRGGMFLSRNQLPDGGLKSQTAVAQIRPGVKILRKPSLEMVSTPNAALSQPVSSSSWKKGPVAIITGVDSILSPAVRVPALLDSGTKSLPSAKANASQKQSGPQPQRFLDSPKGLESRECANNRRLVKRGQSGKQSISTCVPARNETGNAHLAADDSFSEGIPESDGKPHPRSTTKLLKSIMKMFEKEGKNRRNMEEKLMELQGVLESHGGLAQLALAGAKRKRKGNGGSEEKGKKRHRQESKKKVSEFCLDEAVTSPSQRPCTTEDKCLSQAREREVQQNDTPAPGDGPPAQDRLSEMISNLQGRCRGEGLFDTTVGWKENADVCGADEFKDSSDVDVCNDDVLKEGTGTNTDLESTDDDLGEDWWAKKVLLSPISSNDLTS